MKTQPIYLEDPYLKFIEAQIMDVIPEKDDIYRIILDQTVFYPMEGGQPTDQGILTFEDGAPVQLLLLQEKSKALQFYR